MTTRTLSELAELCGAAVEGNGSLVVTGPASLKQATAGEVSFLAKPRYALQLETTRAGAVLVEHGIVCRRADLTLLRCDDPSAAFSEVLRSFATPDRKPEPGLHASAVVSDEATLGEGVSLGPCCVIGPGAVLGERVVLHPGVVVGEDVRIGADSILRANVSIYARVEIGERCLIHSGVVLGADGYGFDPTETGWSKIPQCGTVVIEDEVEIGANTTIDRARFGATRIGRGVKLDNLVHIAHGVEIGAGALIVAQVGIAGSARIGKRSILAGQVGVNGHIEIGDGVRVAGQAGVFSDIPDGQDYQGHPARPRSEALKILAYTRRLPRMHERLRELERRLESLESGSGPDSDDKAPPSAPVSGSGAEDGR